MKILTLALAAMLLTGCKITNLADPQPATGIVDINIDTGDVDDDLADVYLDGRFIGNGEMTLPLSAGTHTIRVHLDGFFPYEREVHVLAGSNEQELNVILRRAPG